MVINKQMSIKILLLDRRPVREKRYESKNKRTSKVHPAIYESRLYFWEKKYSSM